MGAGMDANDEDEGAEGRRIEELEEKD